jgi:hypothetical protein
MSSDFKWVAYFRRDVLVKIILVPLISVRFGKTFTFAIFLSRSCRNPPYLLNIWFMNSLETIAYKP